MGHIQGKGDSTWKKDGEYLGSRGQQRRLEVCFLALHSFSGM